jgi:MFS superfamily sulfate permease-like transporter
MAAIGILLMMKQIPHTLGYDNSAEDDVSFLDENTSSNIFAIKESINSITPGAILLTLMCLGILILWDTKLIKKNTIFSLLPAPLIVVLCGALFNIFTQSYFPFLAILPEHLVNLPVFDNVSKIFSEITLPEFSYFLRSDILFTGVTLALIASIESLLSLEAADKLDPLRRVAPADRELLAQGLGNIISGFIGGLPISAVIVRSSVNINAGAQTKLASFTHGILIFVSIFLFSHIINMIPLACLAAILIYTGFKLAKPAIFIQMYREGIDQFLPFLITIISMILFDSLRGVIIGVIIGLLFVIKNNYHAAFTLTKKDNSYLLRLNKDISFINKAPLRNLLRKINPGSYVLIDGTRASFIDKDILETINDFVRAGNDDGISVELKNVPPKAIND